MAKRLARLWAKHSKQVDVINGAVEHHHGHMGKCGGIVLEFLHLCGPDGLLKESLGLQGDVLDSLSFKWLGSMKMPSISMVVVLTA